MSRRLILFCILVVFCMVGCGDRMYIEETEISLVMGIDLDEEGNLVFYSSAPVFNEQADKKYKISVTKADSVREAREKLDAKGMGFFAGGKLQNILIHKRVLEDRNIFPYLDVMYRDAKNDINARVVAVDGSMEDIFMGQLEGNIQLAIMVKDLADQAESNGYGLAPRLFNYHRGMVDPRMTPYMLMFHPAKEKIVTTGTLLLDKDGKAAFALGKRESLLLRLLKQRKKGPISLLFRMPHMASDKHLNKLHIDILSVDYQIDTDYKRNRFVFTIKMDMTADLTERLFSSPHDTMESIEQWVGKEMEKEFTHLIHKMQREKIDPVGFGVYAEAFQYPHWKRVKDDWPAAWSQAEVHVIPRMQIRSEGVLM